ncbi:MAG: hypothetical protein M3445_05555, partial [Actinomycetota bacterium]|nr:hypothetical protein [Actinomycetota bacterium]
MQGRASRARQAVRAVEERFPAAGSLVARGRGWAYNARNLRRWAQADPAAMSARLDLALALAEPPAEPMLRADTRTTHRCREPGSPTGVICSFATGRYTALLSIATPTLIDYGERHGWDVVVSTEEHLADGRPPPWGRLPLIRELFDRYDLVWWIDADALIVDGSVDIRTELTPGKDLYLVEHVFPWPHGFAASSGVMLWRSSDWSRAFVDELWSLEQYIDHPVWENAALLDLLGYRLNPFGHPTPTSKMARVQFLSPDWNSVWPDPALSPRVHHHGGAISFDDRRRLMLEDLARARHGLAPLMEGERAQRPDRAAGSRRLLTDAYPSDLMSRADLPRLLAERGLVGAGAEIGVFAGEFSARLLWQWPGERLISIDPWASAPATDYVDASNVDDAAFEVLY